MEAIPETPHLAAFRERLAAWRALPAEVQSASMGAPDPGRRGIGGGLHPLHLARSCDYRGRPAFDSHGCDCRRVCMLGKGTPIRGTDATGVSIGDCLECVKS